MFGIFAENEKFPPFTELFQWTKGEQEKYLNMVVKKNPALWLKRNQHMDG